ncbi:MAG: ORF6N domain-containing protein [Flavobacteriia bacterium]|nr:ORF6N domain-containing protein [Flavobacteriia bacterium]
MEIQLIQHKIYDIRGHKVILDFDLAVLYEVENRALKQAVKRNLDRFPEDFMFKLTVKEWKELITNCDKLPEAIKFSPTSPLAFTEQGVSMLSSILRSKKAIQINIAIMRTFVLIRNFALTNNELTIKLKELERKYDKQFVDVFEAINYLIKKDNINKQHNTRVKIGFKTKE